MKTTLHVSAACSQAPPANLIDASPKKILAAEMTTASNLAISNTLPKKKKKEKKTCDNATTLLEY